MEKLLNFVLKLSLQEMALRKVVVHLWNANDILSVIEKFQSDDFGEWLEAENQVKNKVSNLVLPEPLKKQMVCLVRSVGSDIMRWKRFHEYYLREPDEYFDIHVLKQLQWTCVGAIDYRKTVEELIRLKMLDTFKRFRLACSYCLVEYIPLLWEEMDKESQFEFYGDDPFYLIDMQLECIWPYILKGEESELNKLTAEKCVMITRGRSFNQCVLESSACLGNKAATEYFLQLLTVEERESSIMATVYDMLRSRGNRPWVFAQKKYSKGRLADVLCYLLAMMSPDQQMQVLRELPLQVLYCFVDWPFHDLFADIAEVVLNFLHPDRGYDFVLLVRNSGYYFPNLVQKLFLNGPSVFREYFLQNEYYSHCAHPFSCLILFFYDDDTETLKVFLRSVSAQDRVNLVSRFFFFERLMSLTAKDKLNLVELCFHETIQSKEDKGRLKNQYMEFFEKESTQKKLSEREWKLFFKLLNETDVSASCNRNLDVRVNTLVRVKDIVIKKV